MLRQYPRPPALSPAQSAAGRLPAWTRGLAALKFAVAMMMPEGSASAQAREDYVLTPTPKAVVRRMLEIGGAAPGELVADLGSGDGRIPIMAAKDFGARGLGVEIDKALHAKAQADAKAAGVVERLHLLNRDLFETDLSQVTLLTLYLPQSFNLRLRHRVLAQMRPGSRVVSHEFGLGAWLPDHKETVEGRTILLWVVPARVEGRRNVETDGDAFSIVIRQTFQEIEGTAEIAGQSVPLREPHLRGGEIAFSIQASTRPPHAFRGRVEGGKITGLPPPGGVSGWRAVRQ
jgi:hypothetical protein